MTDRQREVLTFIRGHIRHHDGLPPTLGEIADGIGVVSRSTAHSHVLALVRDGYLESRLVRGVSAYFPTGKTVPAAA